MKKRFKNVGGWGTSMGGVPLSHLLSTNPDMSVAIFDKNFDNLEKVIKYSISGSLTRLFKLMFFGDKSNSLKYLKNSTTPKLILSDHQDTIIPHPSSLLRGITSNFFNNKWKDSLKSNTTFLKKVFNDMEYIKFVNSLGVVIENKIIIHNHILNDRFASALKPELNSEIDFKNLNIHLTDENVGLLKNKEKNYTNPSGDCYFVNDGYMEFKEFFEDFDSCGEILTNIRNAYDKEEFLNGFFESFYLWGSHSSIKFGMTNTLNFSSSASSAFPSALQLQERRGEAKAKIEELIIKVDSVIESTRQLDKNSFNSDKINILGFLSSGLKSIIKYINEHVISETESLTLGSIIPINTGHNGLLKREVLMIIEEYLKSIKFI